MSEYINLLFLVFIGFGFGVAILGLSRLIGPRRKVLINLSPYECGVDVVPAPGSENRNDIRFYLVAILFLIFDLEVVFLYPWAYIFREFSRLGIFVLLEMGVFIGILVIGLIYIWKKDVLIW